ERREAAAIREARYKSKMEQYYNKKVRPAGFRPGEFVYRRNEASSAANSSGESNFPMNDCYNHWI
ncbi:hypothetical protein Tco_0477900, partial [Tanacetum coccineum]